MRTFKVDGKTVFVFQSNIPGVPVIFLNTFSDEGWHAYEVAQKAGCPPFTLVAISNLDWNHDMAPWNSPAVFKKGEPFTGGANDYLRLLVEEIIPKAEKSCPGLRHGVGLPGTLWQGCSPCTPSTGRMCSPGWGVCPVPCGFLVSRNTSFPTNRSADRTASISFWGTRRPRPAIQS